MVWLSGSVFARNSCLLEGMLVRLFKSSLGRSYFDKDPLDAPCGRRSRSKTGAIGAYKFGALDGGMTEGQIQMLGAAFG